ncbi:beta-propeller domain-containing protein [Euzebya tangerina]|uniref:beta-propeller domain-containing protein n=1 Tax=Euzebya tangerina TaxID=591198 RepID=UPI000E310297|nr:beta-propeller domain-containing protein [Euzebya tangerina]
MTTRYAAALLLALALVLSACTSAEPDDDELGASQSDAIQSGPPGEEQVPADDPADDREARRLLRPFDSCASLLDYYVDNAVDLVGPYGFGHGGGFEVLEEGMAADSAESAAADGVAQGASTGAPDFSGTNNQEAGVDEADVVKTDGEVIVTALSGRVQIVDAAGATDSGTDTPISEISLPANIWNIELLLSGDVLVVLTSDGAEGMIGPAADGRLPAFPAARTSVLRYDLSDPSSPEPLGGVRFEGSYRAARLIDDTVRMVMVSDPTGLTFTQPDDGGLSAEDEARVANEAIVAASDIDDWVPHLQQIGPDGELGEVSRLGDCTAIQAPSAFAGLSTVSVVTFDASADGAVTPTSSAGVVAAGDTVYASTDRLLLATSPWGRWAVPFIEDPSTPDEGITTAVHSFDISDPRATAYVASGEVDGSIIGQFALSETGGVIRVATTENPQWFGASDEVSSSSLIVLAEDEGDLVEIGRVGDLGLTEQIQSVRYLGPDLAAIVTFRQTDPLYLIDTSDPTAPAVLGELKIPGFSTYLHPVGDGYLIGVGQDADEETGRTLGLQVSLFDIRDLASPQRVAQVTFEGEGFSPAEYDHRAFTYWPETEQAILPVELYPDEETIIAAEEEAEASGEPFEYRPLFQGAVVLDVGEGTLTEAGRVASSAGPDGWGQGVLRTIVIGDVLWTLGFDELQRFDLSTLDPLGSVRL